MKFMDIIFYIRYELVLTFRNIATRKLLLEELLTLAIWTFFLVCFFVLNFVKLQYLSVIYYFSFLIVIRSNSIIVSKNIKNAMFIFGYNFDIMSYILANFIVTCTKVGIGLLLSIGILYSKLNSEGVVFLFNIVLLSLLFYPFVLIHSYNNIEILQFNEESKAIKNVSPRSAILVITSGVFYFFIIRKGTGVLINQSTSIVLALLMLVELMVSLKYFRYFLFKRKHYLIGIKK